MAAPTVGAVGTHLQDSGTATIAVPKPAGVVADSIVVCYIYLDATNTISAMAAGFQHAVGSPQAVTGAGNHVYNVVWKRATGTDGAGTYDFTASAPTFHEADAVRYDGCITTGDPTEGGNGTQTTGVDSATSPAVSLTTTGPDRLIIWTASNWSGGSWTPPSGYSEQFDAGVGTHTGASVAQAVAGSTGSVTGVCTSTDKRTAWIGALMPPAGADDPYAAPPAALPWPILFPIVAANQAMWLAGNVGAQISVESGLAALALGGQGTAVKRAPQTGVAALGLSGQGVARKVAPAAGPASLGLAGYAAARKVAPEQARAVLALAGYGTAVRKAPETGYATLILSGYGTVSTSGVRAQTGVASLALSGRGTAAHKALPAGRAALGLSGQGTAMHKALGVGLAALGLAGRGTALHKATTATGRAVVALGGYGTAGRKAPAAGRAVLALGGYGTVTPAFIPAYVGIDGDATLSGRLDGTAFTSGNLD